MVESPDCLLSLELILATHRLPDALTGPWETAPSRLLERILCFSEDFIDLFHEGLAPCWIHKEALVILNLKL